MERVQVTAAAATMALYDAFWFHRCVLLPSPPPPAPAPERAADAEQPQPAISPSASPTAGRRHRRTRSDEFQQGLEPLRVPNNSNRTARLETILSGKGGMVAAPQPQPLPEPRRPAARRPAGRTRRQRRGRSMSELEFEELKGLQDLGFTFSDADVDAELASIVPGLRRKRSEEETQTPPLATAASAPAAVGTSSLADHEEGAAVPDAPRRPYLSEAWDDDDDEELRAMLRNWRIPAAGDGADMKQHLLVWAHTVASAVR